jgi:hypothetical protein
MRKKIKLSILVCSIVERTSNFLPNIIDILKPQLTSEVELIVLSDNKVISVGEKRNKLISLSNWEYVVFVDDDDRVSTNYVKELLMAIRKDPSVVTFDWQFLNKNKWIKKKVVYSLWIDKDYNEEEVYYRLPNHICCWKKKLLPEFEKINKLEDKKFAEVMKDKSKDLKFKEIYIPKCLYFYDFNQESTQTQKEKEELISIIVPVYNELYYTKQILEDINKKIKNKYEVILIDNGSTDGTKEWVESINMKWLKKIYLKKNYWVNYAWNLWAKEAKWDYLLFINNDIVLTEGIDNLFLKQILDNVIVCPYSTRWDKKWQLPLFTNSPRNLSWWCFFLRKTDWVDIPKELDIWFW